MKGMNEEQLLATVLVVLVVLVVCVTLGVVSDNIWGASEPLRSERAQIVNSCLVHNRTSGGQQECLQAALQGLKEVPDGQEDDSHPGADAQRRREGGHVLDPDQVRGQGEEADAGQGQE